MGLVLAGGMVGGCAEVASFVVDNTPLSIAREVIKMSDYIAIDTDDIIESMENKTIKKSIL